MTEGWYKGCGVTKKEYEHNGDCWHFGHWCMARGVLRGQSNVVSYEKALQIDREEATYFADKLEIDSFSRNYVLHTYEEYKEKSRKKPSLH